MALRTFASGALFATETAPGQRGVVALHGWRRDRHDLERAVGSSPALLFDLPGFGASPPPPDAWGAADYGDHIAAALDEAYNGEPVVVLGHSFGGRVGVCLAARRPDLVAGLVLTGVPLLRIHPAAKPSLRYRLVRAAHRRRLVSDARMNRLREARGSEDYRAATGVMRDVLVKVVNESYAAELAAIVCPVRMVWGERDTAAPLDMAQRAIALLHGDAQLDVLPGVGHDVPREAPDALTKAVSELLTLVT